MGKVKNLFHNIVSKKLKNFNIANRAERTIAKERVKAPPHPSTVEHMSKIETDYQDSFDARNKKNEDLVQMMQGMVVNPDKVTEVRPKNLPLSQDAALDGYFEYEPDVVPEGKVTLRDAMNFITLHHFSEKGGDNTPSNFADKYKLEPVDVEKLLKHFKPFEIHYPLTKEQREENEALAQLGEPQKKEKAKLSLIDQMKNTKKKGNLDAQKDMLEEFTSYEITRERTAQARERGEKQEEILKEFSGAKVEERDLNRLDSRGKNVVFEKDLTYFNDDMDENSKAFEQKKAKRLDRATMKKRKEEEEKLKDIETNTEQVDSNILNNSEKKKSE